MNGICRKRITMPDGCIATWETRRRHWNTLKSGGDIARERGISTPSRCHTFEVYDLPEGEYILEVEIGEESYYGDFIIDKSDSYPNNY